MRKELEYWTNHADLIVKQSGFDKSIYISIYNRKGNEEYFSSQNLAVKMNGNKVIILDKNCKKVIHRNFLTMAEVIG